MDNNTNYDQFPISAEVTSLKDLMRRKYSIPVYQRPYAWGEEQIDDFLNTVYEGYLGGKKKCFFGTMQFNEVNDNLEVVDGQQRLTTIKLFLHVLKILSSVSDDCSISINYKNSEKANDEINQVLCGFSKDNLKKTNRGYYDISDINNKFEANIRMLYIKTRDFFDENKESMISYCDLRNYFIESLYVVALTTKDSKMSLSEIVDIFNTINTTGMDLNGSDVFKIQYFDYLRKKNNDDRCMEKIKNSYARLDAYNDDKPQKEHFYMSDVLTVYKHCICALKGKKYEDLSKSNERFFEEVFNNSIDYTDILEYGVFDKVVELYINLLEKLQKNELCPGTMQTWAYRLIFFTRYSKFWTIPFVWSFCSWWKKRDSLDEIDFQKSVEVLNEILKYFVVNSTRYSKVIYPVHRKICNDIYPELANNDAKKIRDILSSCVWNNPYDLKLSIKEDYNSILIDDGLSKSKCGIILACLLLAIDAEIKKQTSDEKIRDMFFSKNPFDVEHTYSRAEYEKDTTISNKDKRLMNGIGNLVLLERNINQDMGRGGVLLPKAKSDGKWYERSEYTVIRNIIGNLPDWNTDVVKEFGKQRIDRLDELLSVKK